MNDLQLFRYNTTAIRTTTLNGEPWLVLKDICDALGLSDTSKIALRLEDDELTRIKFVSGGQNREMLAVNEAGLYNVILRSDKPEAKTFKRWVTHEVLPAIRQTGGYIPIGENETEQDILARALLIADKSIKRLQGQLTAQQPQVIFANAVAASHTSILIGELAKLLRQNGIDMGQNRLFEWLRKNGYLISRRGTDRNMPTQYSMERGLFEIKETSISHSDGHITISKTPKVTGKGQIYFINKFQAG